MGARQRMHGLHSLEMAIAASRGEAPTIGPNATQHSSIGRWEQQGRGALVWTKQPEQHINCSS